MEGQIADELVRVHDESYGAGVRETAVHFVDDTVIVILDIELTRAERTLFDAGHTAEVKSTREGFQRAIEPTFRAIVERATGRKVDAFLSTMSTEPLYSVEIFRLEPAG
jgi:uncharacterized protein YbcI